MTPVAARSPTARLDGLKRFAAVLAISFVVGYALLATNRATNVETNARNAAQEEAILRSADRSLIGLRNYLKTCRICAFKTEALAQIAKLEFEEVARSEELSYRAAGGSLDRLRTYAETCIVCAFKKDAVSEIQRLEREQMREREASKYRAARGNLDRLKDYVANCVVCAFKSDANIEIANIERTMLARQEETEYRAARANLQLLRAYVRDCRVCDFVTAARSEIASLEEPKVEFEIVNNTSDTINVAFYDGSNREPIDPADGRLYIQYGGRKQTYSVSCTPGQNVCYSAVVQGSALNAYWGLGFRGKQSCVGCCLLCQGGSAIKTLNLSDARRPPPTITWQITDNTSVQLSIAFYSQNRFQLGWPGWNQNWSVTLRESKFTLNCQAGEKICYGAWTTNNIDGTYWGVGPYNKYGCTNCCAVCDGGTHLRSLSD
jgi:hypothetical protein